MKALIDGIIIQLVVISHVDIPNGFGAIECRAWIFQKTGSIFDEPLTLILEWRDIIHGALMLRHVHLIEIPIFLGHPGHLGLPLVKTGNVLILDNAVIIFTHRGAISAGVL